MEKVLVLKNDMTILGTTDWQTASSMIVSGKAEVIAEDKTRKIHPRMYLPLAIRLIKAIRNLWKVEVPWGKHNVHIRDDFTCQYCGLEMTRSGATIDHVIPKDQGGKNSWENTVSSCFPCNNKKNNRTPSQARMGLKKNPYKPTIMEFIMKQVKHDGLEEMLNQIFK